MRVSLVGNIRQIQFVYSAHLVTRWPKPAGLQRGDQDEIRLSQFAAVCWVVPAECPHLMTITSCVTLISSARCAIVWGGPAGPCGYGVRQLTSLGPRCDVGGAIANSAEAVRSMKTNLRDAIMLARLNRAGELTPRVGARRRSRSHARPIPAAQRRAIGGDASASTS